MYKQRNLTTDAVIGDCEAGGAVARGVDIGKDISNSSKPRFTLNHAETCRELEQKLVKWRKSKEEKEKEEGGEEGGGQGGEEEGDLLPQAYSHSGTSPLSRFNFLQPIDRFSIQLSSFI